jgi:nitrate reductase NapD
VNICGVLLHARPGRLDAVRSEVAGLPGVEIHHVTADSRLILTVEERDEALAGETVLALHRVEGVLSAAIVYHHFEPEQEASDAAVQA